MLHITKVKPLFTNIVTTGDVFEEDMVDKGILVAKKGDLKLWQTVLEVGNMVRDIKPGDKVMIDIKDYVTRKYDPNSIRNDMDANPIDRVQLNWITIDDENGNPHERLLLKDRDIQYIFEGEEKNDIILTQGKPSIIV